MYPTHVEKLSANLYYSPADFGTTQIRVPRPSIAGWNEWVNLYEGPINRWSYVTYFKCQNGSLIYNFVAPYNMPSGALAHDEPTSDPPPGGSATVEDPTQVEFVTGYQDDCTQEKIALGLVIEPSAEHWDQWVPLLTPGPGFLNNLQVFTQNIDGVQNLIFQV